LWRGERRGEGLVGGRAGPLEPHVIGLAEELLRQGYTRTSAAQHACFRAHLDRWMSSEGIGLGELSGPVIERYPEKRRAAGYVESRSVKALQPLLDYPAPLGGCGPGCRLSCNPLIRGATGDCC
jgi:hypothetical protein